MLACQGVVSNISGRGVPEMGPEACCITSCAGRISHLALALKEKVMDRLHQLQATLDLGEMEGHCRAEQRCYPSSSTRRERLMSRMIDFDIDE